MTENIIDNNLKINTQITRTQIVNQNKIEKEGQTGTSQINTSIQNNSDPGYKGLANIGATCYMNSLLQTLFMTEEFRSNIYKWVYDAKVDSKIQDSILYQLQKLFAKLQTRHPGDIDTKQLTRSFQWGVEEIFQQQDIQEFNRVLFQAIQLSLLDSKLSNHQKNDFMKELYEGIMIYYTKCKVCLQQYPRQQTFQDLVLNIKNKHQKIYNDSVELGLQRYLKPQLLQGSNMYQCENCGVKVVAERGVRFLKLPKLLSLILQRFTFDYYTMSRNKINDRVSFPWILNMNDYMNGYEGIKNKLDQDKSKFFVNDQPIILKKPTVIKKSTFTKTGKKDSKVVANNILNKPNANTRSFITQMKKKTGKVNTVDVAIQISVGQKNSQIIQNTLQTQKAIQQSLLLPTTLPPLPPLPTDLPIPTLTQSLQLKNPPQQLKNISDNNQKNGQQNKKVNNQLKIQQRLQFDKALNQFSLVNQNLKQKYLQQGPFVYQLYSILIHNGGANHGHYYAYIHSEDNNRWYCFNDYTVKQINISELQKNVYGGSGGNSGSNAYVLYYRLVEKKQKNHVKNPIPNYIKQILQTERQQFFKVKQEKQRDQQITIKLKIHYQLWVKSLEIVNTATLKQCLEKSKVLMGVQHFMGISSNNIRLRMFNPSNQMKLQTFMNRQNLSLVELKIGSHKNLIIQTKKDDQVFDEYIMGLTFLRIVLYDAQNNYDSLQQSALKTHKVSFPKNYTIRQLQSLIKQTFKFSEISLIKKHRNDEYSYHELINTTDNGYYDKTIQEIPIFQNQLLFLEQTKQNLMWPNIFQMDNYRITLKYSLPSQSLQQNQKLIFQNLIFDSRRKLFDLKQQLCKKHKLNPENLILKRTNKIGIQLKNLEDSLRQYRFITGTQIYLQEGIPTKPGQTRIILYFSIPTQLDSLNVFHTFEEISEVPINGNLKASQIKQILIPIIKKKRPDVFKQDLTIQKFRIRQKLTERMTKIYRDSKPMRQQQLIEKRTVAIQLLSETLTVGEEPFDAKYNSVYIRIFDPQNWHLSERFQIIINNKSTTMAQMASIIYTINQSILPQNMQIVKIVNLHKFCLLDLAQFEYCEMNGIDILVALDPLFINNDGLFFVIKDRTKILRELTPQQEKMLGGSPTIKKPIRYNNNSNKGSYKATKKQKGVVITVKKNNSQTQKTTTSSQNLNINTQESKVEVLIKQEIQQIKSQIEKKNQSQI